MKQNKWEHFERLVAAIHKAADAGATVKWNDKINRRQFDVTIRFRKGLYDHLTVVECKDYENAVPVEKVEAFVTKARDARANVAVLASSSGFQSGAQECADRHNITLLHVTTTDDVDPGIFGAKWGELVDTLLIEEITLEFVGGHKKQLPSRSNVLTYYAHHTILECGGKRTTLNAAIDQHLSSVGDLAAVSDFVIPMPEGTTVVEPRDGVVPLKTLAAIHLHTQMTKARAIQGPNMIDPSALLPNVSVRNVSTGEERTFKFGELALGIGTEFAPGNFYESPTLGYFYYCEAINGDTADMWMVESFQLGQLVQMRAKLKTESAKHYVPVTDKETLQRIQGRLDRLKGR